MTLGDLLTAAGERLAESTTRLQVAAVASRRPNRRQAEER